MITPRKVRNHLFIALFCSVALFFSAVIISAAFENYFTPQNVAGRLTREIAASCRELDTEIDKLASVNLEDNSSF